MILNILSSNLKSMVFGTQILPFFSPLRGKYFLKKHFSGDSSEGTAAVYTAPRGPGFTDRAVRPWCLMSTEKTDGTSTLMGVDVMRPKIVDPDWLVVWNIFCFSIYWE